MPGSCLTGADHFQFLGVIGKEDWTKPGFSQSPAPPSCVGDDTLALISVCSTCSLNQKVNSTLDRQIFIPTYAPIACIFITVIN